MHNPTAPRARIALWAALLICAPAGASAKVAPPSPPGTVQIWATSADGTRRLSPQPAIPLGPRHPVYQAGAQASLTIAPHAQGPEIDGFGAALTDASALVLSAKGAANPLSPTQRHALLRELFGAQGLGLSMLRLPIGASDFSTHAYSYDDMAPGQTDPALRHFQLAPAREAQIPLLREIARINPRLKLMATPWSAPGWMKDSDSLIGGTLSPGHYGDFAAYLARYLTEMRKAHVPIALLSVQNEPRFEPRDYPGMRLSSQGRAKLIGQYLGPLLARRHLATRILDWDHNWDHPEEPQGVLAQPAAARYTAGIAWHCYAGDSAVMGEVARANPAKSLYLTECSGGEWSPDWGDTLGWMTDNLIIATLAAGGRGTMLWNLALDENHGPHHGGCTDCRAVVTIDSHSGAVTRNVEYYVLGQISRFLRPGARVLASRYTATATASASAITTLALRNRDGGYVLLAHNTTKAPASLDVNDGQHSFRANLPAGEVASFVWAGPHRQ